MRFLLFLFLFPLWVQALEVTSRVNTTEVALNESFVLEITIQYEKENLEDMEIPDFSQNEDFYLINQSQSTQHSIQIINGKMNRTNVSTINYTLQPKGEGTFKIKPLTVKLKGQAFQTQEHNIKVVKENKNKAPAKPQQKNSPFSMPAPFYNPNSLFDIFANPFEKKETQPIDIKLHFNLNKQSFYKGEMIQANWFVLTSSKSINYDIYKLPKLSGFWKEELKNKRPKHLRSTEVIDKVLYQKNLLEGLWLFPLQTGQLTIDPYVIQILFPFSFRTRGKIKSFPNRSITVKELPLEGRDESFTGAVGVFKVKASIKNQEAIVNQPLSYIISFEGLGHPRFIDLPELKFPSSVQTYPPVKTSSFSDLGNGKKDFEILVVPQKKGLLEIPSFKLSAFNPIKKQYEVHETPPFSFNVKEGKGHISQGEKFFKSDKEKNSKTTMPFEPLTHSFWPQFLSHKRSTNFWIFCSIFFFFCIMVLFFKIFVFKKEKTLKQKVQSQIKSIEELLKKQLWRKACTQMIHLNYSVLYEKQTQDLVADWRQALENLPPSLNKKYASQFEELLKELESLSFGQKDQNQKEAMEKTHKLFSQTKTLIHSFLSNS